MRQRKIYHLLSIFDEGALAGFREFLSSPYLNQSRTLLLFFELWVEKVLRDESEADNLSVEAFLAGSGIQPYRMDKLCSQLYTKAKMFLSYEEFGQKTVLQEKLLLSRLAHLAPHSLEYQRSYKSILKKNSKLPDSGKKHFDQVEIIRQEMENNIRNRKMNRPILEDLQELNFHLDEYYILEKLRLSCANTNLKKIINQDVPEKGKNLLALLPEIEKEEKISPLANAYWQVAQMLQDEDGEQNYLELINLLKKHASTFETETSRELHYYALNFCIRQRNRGRLEFEERVAAMYQLLLENGLLFQNGKLLPAQMKNLVLIHCQLGKLDWVGQFLKDYSKFLPRESAAQMKVYNEGLVAFYARDFATAISRFREALQNPLADDFYELDVRLHLWKSYFEHLDHLSPEEMDAMFRLYDSFRVFIERHDRISETHKKQYRNFIREFKAFMVLLEKAQVPLEDLKNLELRLESMSLIGNKNWFLQKVREVIKSQES